MIVLSVIKYRSLQLQIIRAVCDVPSQLAPFLYPVINLSTNVNDPCHVYLMEDGLDLWLAVLENSFTVTPELFSLCDNILPIIGKLMTNVIIVTQDCAKVLESH